MGKANSKTCSTIRYGLDYLCEISRQTINYKKSRIICSKNCNTSTTTDISSYLGIKSNKSIRRYLEFPIINGNPTYKDYQHIIDSMRVKLSGWKTKCLNLAGKATLISSTLLSQLTYYMQYTLLPFKTLKTIKFKESSYGVLMRLKKIITSY